MAVLDGAIANMTGLSDLNEQLVTTQKQILALEKKQRSWDEKIAPQQQQQAILTRLLKELHATQEASAIEPLPAAANIAKNLQPLSVAQLAVLINKHPSLILRQISKTQAVLREQHLFLKNCITELQKKQALLPAQLYRLKKILALSVDDFSMQASPGEKQLLAVIQKKIGMLDEQELLFNTLDNQVQSNFSIAAIELENACPFLFPLSKEQIEELCSTDKELILVWHAEKIDSVEKNLADLQQALEPDLAEMQKIEESLAQHHLHLKQQQTLQQDIHQRFEKIVAEPTKIAEFSYMPATETVVEGSCRAIEVLSTEGLSETRAAIYEQHQESLMKEQHLMYKVAQVFERFCDEHQKTLQIQSHQLQNAEKLFALQLDFLDKIEKKYGLATDMLKKMVSLTASSIQKAKEPSLQERSQKLSQEQADLKKQRQLIKEHWQPNNQQALYASAKKQYELSSQQQDLLQVVNAAIAKVEILRQPGGIFLALLEGNLSKKNASLYQQLFQKNQGKSEVRLAKSFARLAASKTWRIGRWFRRTLGIPNLDDALYYVARQVMKTRSPIAMQALAALIVAEPALPSTVTRAPEHRRKSVPAFTATRSRSALPHKPEKTTSPTVVSQRRKSTP
jgi:hypothetical protein